jgi:hypothetical protein
MSSFFWAKETNLLVQLYSGRMCLPKEVEKDTNGIKEKIVVITREELIQSQLNEINQKLDIIYEKLIKDDKDKE